MGDEDTRTVWVGNFDPATVTEEILYELFLQAGPLQYVRIPKDRATGQLKNFGFVCFRHDDSVAYSIDLLDGIPLFRRDLKVQSRKLRELQNQGLAPRSSGGIQTLDPFIQAENNGPPNVPENGPLPNGPPPLDCGGMGILGALPNSMGLHQGHIPHHLIALAQQQAQLLTAFQPIPLSVNPLLNAHGQRSSDRFGSIGHDRNFQGQGGNFHPRHYRHDRDRQPRSVDHNTMQAMKSRFNQMVEENSTSLAQVQQRQGRFDYNRLAPPQNNHNRHNGDDYQRRHERDSHGSRHHHRHDDGNDFRNPRNEGNRNFRGRDDLRPQPDRNGRDDFRHQPDRNSRDGFRHQPNKHGRDDLRHQPDRNDSRHSRNEADRHLNPSKSVHDRLRFDPYNRNTRY